MTRTFDVSSRLPEGIPEALTVLDGHLRKMRVPYLVIGALARDVTTSLIQDAEPERATRDIDLAIRVDSMEQFRVATQGLDRIGQSEHKFMAAGVEVDLVPFGDIAADGMLEFTDSILDIRGLSQAAEHSDRVRVSADLIVDTASVPALAILKILAWNARGSSNPKDAIDLGHLFRAVAEKPYADTAWEHSSAGPLVDYDGSLIGAAWLGYEAARIGDKETHTAVCAVLTSRQTELAHDLRSGRAIERLDAERLEVFTQAFSSVQKWTCGQRGQERSHLP